MNILQFDIAPQEGSNPTYFYQLFSAKAARTGGVIRRPVKEVETEVGRDLFMAEVAHRGFHVIECAGQFIVICTAEKLVVHR